MGTTSKALSLLDIFDSGRDRIGLSELARASGVNKATCFRLMSELAGHGLVEQITEGGDYRIGPAVLRLAALREAAVPTRDAALPILQGLAEQTSETTHMSHLIGRRLNVVAIAYASVQAVRVTIDVAEELPFHSTASGHAVMGWAAPDLAAEVFDGVLPARTANTLTDPARLRAAIAEVRAQGWAVSDSSNEDGVASVAVPLFNARGSCQGAMAVTAPAARTNRDMRAANLRRLVRAARDAMAAWGGTPPGEIDALWRRIA